MPPRVWPADELVAALVAPGEPEVAGQVVLVGPPSHHVPAPDVTAALDRLATVPVVVVGEPGWEAGGLLDLVDVATHSDDEVAELAGAVERTPAAALAAVLHLRAAPRRTVAEGLVAESALYSALQAGPEHHRWRAATPVRRGAAPDGPRIRVTRVADELHIVLARPEVRNALDAAMRDQLLEALAVAEADPSLHVVLRGDGPAFCSGGDLDEFGTAPDPPAAHLIRLRRSLGVVLHRLADRTTVVVHGPSAGSGIELPAFAGRVVAHPDATFVLPELSMGLIPGAGGTVSLPARIGRHRTAWLVLTGRTIDAPTAHSWGLVDEIGLI
jgi:enoyl-CoA hydratase/carnithine racemase